MCVTISRRSSWYIFANHSAEYQFIVTILHQTNLRTRSDGCLIQRKGPVGFGIDYPVLGLRLFIVLMDITAPLRT